ncbi:hypothetical protein [Nitrospira sp. BLG_2]|uniref:hypothetical protein n=1 Tax=Nitrospira sp. BLG_2 TaxID=3397507 RepID=UPI003B99401F
MLAGKRLNRFVRSGFLLAPFILLACSSGGVGESASPSSSQLLSAGPPITWAPRNPMPTPRTEFGVATVNNKIYAIRGYSGLSSSNSKRA